MSAFGRKGMTDKVPMPSDGAPPPDATPEATPAGAPKIGRAPAARQPVAQMQDRLADAAEELVRHRKDADAKRRKAARKSKPAPARKRKRAPDPTGAAKSEPVETAGQTSSFPDVSLDHKEAAAKPANQTRAERQAARRAAREARKQARDRRRAEKRAAEQARKLAQAAKRTEREVARRAAAESQKRAEPRAGHKATRPGARADSPADSHPIDARPVEASSVDAGPVETSPAEASLFDARTAEADPAEASAGRDPWQPAAPTSIPAQADPLVASPVETSAERYSWQPIAPASFPAQTDPVEASPDETSADETSAESHPWQPIAPASFPAQADPVEASPDETSAGRGSRQPAAPASMPAQAGPAEISPIATVPAPTAPDRRRAARPPATPAKAPPATRPAARSDDEQMRFLAQSALLEEAGTPRLLRTALFGVTALVACAIAWASVTKVDEVTVGQGQVLPSGRVQTIQHLEGGIVRVILVREGTLVKKGDVLIRMDTASVTSELDQERAKATILSLQADRLQAFAEGKGWKPLTLVGKLSRYKHLVADQLALLAQQRRERMSQRVVIQAQIRTRQAELVVLQKTAAGLKRQLAVVTESYRMRERLLKQGVTSRADYLEIKRDFERTTGELNAVYARAHKAKEELSESRERLGELDDRLRREALAERGKITAELAQVREKLKRILARSKRLEIRAPTAGYVKGLKVNTIGGVIQPGQPIMEIVPAGRELIVESRITTRDIGHVHIGQRAKVKVDTYDFARYGAITGRLKSISATTFQDDDGRPYYKGVITLDKAYVGRNPRGNPVTPGMTVQAEIVTGSKSILAYLLKPIYTTLNSGFRER